MQPTWQEMKHGVREKLIDAYQKEVVLGRITPGNCLALYWNPEKNRMEPEEQGSSHLELDIILKRTGRVGLSNYYLADPTELGLPYRLGE